MNFAHLNHIKPVEMKSDGLNTKSHNKADKNPKRTFLYQFLRNLILVFGISAMTGIMTIAPNTLMAQEVSDTAGVKDLVTSYQAIWNTRNPIAIAKFFSEDADMVFGNLPAARGRDEIEASWQNYFDRQEPERRGWFDIISVRLLRPAIALVDILSTTGIAGDTSTFRKARGTWVVHQNQGKWMISAMRGLPTTEGRVELVASMETAKLLRPQIRALVASYEEKFNQHDPKALSDFFHNDANIIIREQSVIQGGEAILDYWQNYFSQPRPYLALFIVDDIRMLSEDVAILNVIATGAGLGMQDNLVPTRMARGTWVIVREDGKWLITALRVLPGKYDRVIRHTRHR